MGFEVIQDAERKMLVKYIWVLIYNLNLWGVAAETLNAQTGGNPMCSWWVPLEEWLANVWKLQYGRQEEIMTWLEWPKFELEISHCVALANYLFFLKPGNCNAYPKAIVKMKWFKYLHSTWKQ